MMVMKRIILVSALAVAALLQPLVKGSAFLSQEMAGTIMEVVEAPSLLR